MLQGIVISTVVLLRDDANSKICIDSTAKNLNDTNKDPSYPSG